jgi:hypothetical protein
MRKLLLLVFLSTAFIKPTQAMLEKIDPRMKSTVPSNGFQPGDIELHKKITKIVANHVDKVREIKGRCFLGHNLTFNDGGTLILAPHAELIIGHKGKAITLFNLKQDSLVFKSDTSRITLIGDVIFDFLEDVYYQQGILSIPPFAILDLISKAPGLEFFSPSFHLDLSPYATIHWSKRQTSLQ